MVRIYHRHPDRFPLRARTFGPLNRFDPQVRDRHQQPREQRDGRGVIYFARDVACGLAESFPGQSPEVLICPNRYALLAAPRADSTLLDLTGNGVLHIGAVGTLGAGNERRRMTQRWARAIYEDFPTLDGIRYRAAHQGGIAVALWERGEPLQSAPDTGAPGYALAGALLNRVTHQLALQGRAPVPIPAVHCADCTRAGLA